MYLALPGPDGFNRVDTVALVVIQDPAPAFAALFKPQTGQTPGFPCSRIQFERILGGNTGTTNDKASTATTDVNRVDHGK